MADCWNLFLVKIVELSFSLWPEQKLHPNFDPCHDLSDLISWSLSSVCHHHQAVGIFSFCVRPSPQSFRPSFLLKNNVSTFLEKSSRC